MKKISKKLTTTMVALGIFSMGSILAYALDLEGGELVYHGGQTKEIIYSEIQDKITDNDKYWSVYASVKVGGNTYNSGWQNDYAYKEADRVWYANESSYYDYKAR